MVVSEAAVKYLPPGVGDIVSINVCGEITQVSRETLLLPAGSRFAALFSGRLEDRCVWDSEGRIFLDHDPELVRIILNYLRMKRIEDPSDPLDPPVVSQEKNKEWCCLLKHYGLTSFFAGPSSRRYHDMAALHSIASFQYYSPATTWIACFDSMRRGKA
jgi:BTB/POZ domain